MLLLIGWVVRDGNIYKGLTKGSQSSTCKSELSQWVRVSIKEADEGGSSPARTGSKHCTPATP